jgi:hypothetical protein
MRTVIILLACVAAAGGRSTRVAVNPEVELKRSCTRCHRLDVVRAQRLSREDWERELDKMASMGARVANRAALVAYLAKKYGNSVGDPGERTK